MACRDQDRHSSNAKAVATSTCDTQHNTFKRHVLQNPTHCRFPANDISQRCVPASAAWQAPGDSIAGTRTDHFFLGADGDHNGANQSPSSNHATSVLSSAVRISTAAASVVSPRTIL